jgi:hypothetical protein
MSQLPYPGARKRTQVEFEVVQRRRERKENHFGAALQQSLNGRQKNRVEVLTRQNTR